MTTPAVITVAITGSIPTKTDNPAVPVTPALFYRLDGAYSQVDDNDTALRDGRSPRFVVFPVGLAPDAQLLAADRSWVRGFWDALRPHAIGSGDGYINGMVDYGDDACDHPTAPPSTTDSPRSRASMTRRTSSISTPTSRPPDFWLWSGVRGIG